jgi:hypothetical protein
MSNLTDMTYGAYNFGAQAGPIPTLSIIKTYLRSADGTKLGSTYQTTIDGTLTPMPSGLGGYKNLDTMQDALVDAFDLDGQHFHVTCNGSTLISEYPRINSVRLDKSNDQWTLTTPYTIDMEWDGETISGDIYIEGVQETWDIEFDEQSSVYSWNLDGTGDNNTSIFRLTHNVSAKGIPHYSGGVLTRAAWEHAKLFCMTKLGYDVSMVAQTGVLNIPTTNLSGYNHMRTVQVDELGGSYSVSESWLVANFSNGNNAGRAIEDFTATVNFSQENGLTSIDVNGTIQGVETRTYGSAPGSFSIIETKDKAASGYWESIRPKLYGRARFAADGLALRNVNPQVVGWSVGRNPTKGVINYSYQYDDRLCNFITGALMEDININDEHPTDVFASIFVLGRARGPILQDLNTVTSSVRNVSIDLVMNPTGNCTVGGLNTGKPTAQVENLLCQFQSDISAAQIFKSADNESWNPKTGRYSRQVSWTFSSCTGDAPSTDFCS